MKAGKWIGGFLGFMFLGGSPIGALLGWWLGSKIDDSLEDDTEKLGDSKTTKDWGDKGFSSQRDQNADMFVFQMGLLALMAAVMKADGEQKKSELDKIKEYIAKAFPTEKDQKNALQMLKSYLTRPSIDVNGICSEVKLHLNIAQRRELIHFLLGVAFADGELDYREDNLIRNMASLLNVSTREYEAIKVTYQRTYDNQNSSYQQSNNSHQQQNNNQGGSYQRNNGYGGSTTYNTQNNDWAYTQLGITKAATNEEVKKAYRSMAKKFHPDRVSNLGEAVVKEANKRFEKINEAYEVIKKERGMN